MSLATTFSSENRYEVSLGDTREQQVSLPILTRESRENFESEKRVSLLAKIFKN